MSGKFLSFHLMKWKIIQRIVAETGKPVTVALTEFNGLVRG
jgi:hypothetical protein